VAATSASRGPEARTPHAGCRARLARVPARIAKMKTARSCALSVSVLSAPQRFVSQLFGYNYRLIVTTSRHCFPKSSAQKTPLPEASPCRSPHAPRVAASPGFPLSITYLKDPRLQHMPQADRLPAPSDQPRPQRVALQAIFLHEKPS